MEVHILGIPKERAFSTHTCAALMSSECERTICQRILKREQSCIIADISVVVVEEELQLLIWWMDLIKMVLETSGNEWISWNWLVMIKLKKKMMLNGVVTVWILWR